MSCNEDLTGDQALKEFREAVDAAPPKPPTLVLSEENVAAAKPLTKRSLEARLSRASTKRPKKSLTASSSTSSLSATDHSLMLASLNKQAFPLDRGVLSELGDDVILEKAQCHLMEVMSVCHHVQTELKALKQEMTCLKTDNDTLKAAKDREIAQLSSALTTSKTENVSLEQRLDGVTKELQQMKEGRDELKIEYDQLQRKTRIAVPAAKIRVRWAMICDFKKGLAPGWNAIEAEKSFREVAKKEAELEGRTPPIFDEAYTDFGDCLQAQDTSAEQ